MAALLWLIAVLALAPLSGLGADRILFRDDFNSLNRWRPLLFPKISAHTRYSAEKQDGQSVLAARSRASASALVYRETFSVYDYPRLRWRWRVENVYRDARPEEKGGDDYPLRVYVTFAYDPDRAGALERLQYGLAKGLYGEYPPHSSLTYVWASWEGQARIITSPYTDRAVLMVLQKGGEKAGRWQTEEVDLLSDYRRAFGVDPPATASLAVMNDSDDTGQASLSYLDFIEVFRHEK